MAKKLDHKSLQTLTFSDLVDVDPLNIDLGYIRKAAKVVESYVKDTRKDPYEAMVRAFAAAQATSAMLEPVTYLHIVCSSESKKQKALAILERSEQWAKEKETKLTDTLRKSYADQDADYLAAVQKEAAAKAMLSYLYNKHGEFLEGLNIAKKRMSIDKQDEGNAGLTDNEMRDIVDGDDF